MHRSLSLFLVLGLVGVACGGGPASDGDGDSDVDSDSDGDSDSDVGSAWTLVTVAGDDVGRYSSIDVDSDGNVGVGYYAFHSHTDGECDIDPAPVIRSRVPLYYASLAAGSDTWATETVTEPVYIDMPRGLSFRFAPDDTPSMAVWGGEPLSVLCSANDAELWERGSAGWTSEAAAIDGSTPPPADAPDFCNVESSVAGYTVGAWPALAFDSTGNPAIMYRDTHFGGMQSDIMVADAEVAYRQAGWTRSVVYCSNGAGRDNAAVFDSEDRLVVAHRVTTEDQIEDGHGLWVHRQEADGSWIGPALPLTAGQVGLQESGIVAGDDGAIALIYFDPVDGLPYVVELELPDLFRDGSSWVHTRIGDPSYDEGLDPSIARAPTGELAVAYRRCNRTGLSESGCDDNVDALIFAWRNATTADWSYEVVDEGARGECGTDVSLAFAPDGTAYVSYACIRDVAGGQFVAELKVATRSPL